MRSFCVECGKEGLVYEGLCQECLPKKRRFAKLPSKLELRQCQHCGAYDLPGGWRQEPLEGAVRDLVAKAVEIPRDVRSHEISVGVTPEDDRNLIVGVSTRVSLEGIDIIEEWSLRVLIRAATCPDCSKQRGAYFEGIIQVRAEGRPLKDTELGEARRAIEERVAATDGVFVSKEEEVHGGLDVYVSSNETARSIAKALRARLGGTFSSSPKLHTRKEGKDLYRVTYLVRLPGVSAGDIVEIQGRPHQILSTGEPTHVIDLERGQRRTVPSQEISEATRMEAELVRGTIISQTPEEVQVMDSDGYRVRIVMKPPELDLEGDEVTLIITIKGDYIAPPRSSW